MIQSTCIFHFLEFLSMFPLEHSLVQLYEAPHHDYSENFSLSEQILRLHIEILNRLQQARFDGVANS